MATPRMRPQLQRSGMSATRKAKCFRSFRIPSPHAALNTRRAATRLHRDDEGVARTVQRKRVPNTAGAHESSAWWFVQSRRKERHRPEVPPTL